MNFALARTSSLNNIASELRVAVDPDDYPVDDEDAFIAYFVTDAGELTEARMTGTDYNTNRPWPLLLINAFEHLPQRSLGKTNAAASAIPGSYISLQAIDIKHENDPIGNEEFEIFDREEDLFENVLNYCAGQILPEAFDVKLDARKKGLTPIEDDNEKGVHHNGATSDPCVNEYRFQWVRADRWDLGIEQWDNLKFHINPSGRKDDVYTYSGAFGFTLSNPPFFPSTWDADNADLGLRLVKETVN